MQAVEGVEINEDSRFIDHSQATEWETFVACLHDFVRTTYREHDNCTNLEFNGQSFELYPARDRNHVQKFLESIFGVTNATVLALVGDLTRLSLSKKNTIVSALETAVSSVNSFVPLFFLSDNVKEIYGYAHNKDTIQYQSSIIESVTSKHELFYFDGVIRLFLQRLYNLTRDDVGTILCDVAEHYMCSVTDEARNSNNFQSFTEDDNMDKTEKMFSKCWDKSIYQENPFAVSILKELWLPVVISREVLSPRESISSQSSVSVSQSLRHSDVGVTVASPDQFLIQVTIAWENIPHDSIVENDRFTTLLASKVHGFSTELVLS